MGVTMALTKEQAAIYLSEFLESGGKKVILYCADHGVLGKNFPVHSCKNCWTIYYLKELAKKPPHLRAESLEKLVEMVHHMTEAADKGELDFQPFAHPRVEIEKNKLN